MLSSLTTFGADIVLASNGETTGANPIAGLLPFLLIGVVFYFLIIRPQKKKQQEQQAMVRSIGVGDQVVTIGGFHGTVVGLTDDAMELELTPGVVVTLARNAISRTLSEPTPMDDLDFDDEDEDDEFGTAYDPAASSDPLTSDPLADDVIRPDERTGFDADGGRDADGR